LAYQGVVSCASQPMTHSLQSPECIRILSGEPVITLIGVP